MASYHWQSNHKRSGVDDLVLLPNVSTGGTRWWPGRKEETNKGKRRTNCQERMS